MQFIHSEHYRSALRRLKSVRLGISIALFHCIMFMSLPTTSINADEVVLDESLTEMQTVGDFDVVTFVSPVDISEQGLLTDEGEIEVGKLISFYRSRGIESVYELNLCLDVESGIRTDQHLNSIELIIGDENSQSNQVYRLGDNILKLPGYEASDFKPEAGLNIKLDFDLMQEFDETSTEKIRVTVDGETGSAVPVRVAYLAQADYFFLSRFTFVLAFALFWVFVFLVLFRVTTPKDRNVASPA